MFRKTITLFTIFDFAVRIDLSWIVILVLVVGSLAGAVFPASFPGLHWVAYLAMGLAAALGLFASIVLHELCHSLVARRYGLPMKGITLFLFGGVAEMSDQPPSPKAELLMALAGPLASVGVAGTFLALAFAGDALGWPATVNGVLRWIGYINAILAAFNMIPGFPLDGGRVLRAILWQAKGDLRRATRTASRVGAGFGAVLIGLGVANLLLLNPIGGMWWILIGLFIRGAAQQGYQQVLIRQTLRGEPVRRFMNPDPVTVGPEVSVHDLVDHYVYEHHFKMYPVVDDGRLLGCVTTREVKQIPREQWSSTGVGDIAVDCSDGNTVGPETDAMDALTTMNSADVSRVMVAEDGRLDGVLSLKDLLKFLSLKLELEADEPAGAGGTMEALDE